MTDQTPIATPAIRHDGWTPERQVRFLDPLAAGGNVRAACARVGLSREAAYRLKRREPLFARAWGAALVLAREPSAEVLANRAIDGVEEDVWYRGEKVGTRRKYDTRLLLAHLARLDKAAEANPAAGEDADRFDELLALVAGEAVPEEISIDEVLPAPREVTVVIAGEEAADAWEQEPHERTDEDSYAAGRRARAEAAVRWDGWFAHACGSVDRLLDGVAIDSVNTVSNVSTSPGGRIGSVPLSQTPAPSPFRRRSPA